MNETLGFMVAAFVALAIAARRIIGENRRLKRENDRLRDDDNFLRNLVIGQRRRIEWIESELGATEDAAEQERETP